MLFVMTYAASIPGAFQLLSEQPEPEPIIRTIDTPQISYSELNSESYINVNLNIILENKTTENIITPNRNLTLAILHEHDSNLSDEFYADSLTISPLSYQENVGIVVGNGDLEIYAASGAIFLPESTVQLIRQIKNDRTMQNQNGFFIKLELFWEGRSIIHTESIDLVSLIEEFDTDKAN